MISIVCVISKSDYHRELNTDGTVGFITMNCSGAYKASDRLSFLRGTRGERKIILWKLTIKRIIDLGGERKNDRLHRSPLESALDQLWLNRRIRDCS